MKWKRLLVSALAAACAATLLFPTAFAHGGCHRRAYAAPCLSDGSCQAQGYHTHNGVTYCGHVHGDGTCTGSCAPLCQVEGCLVTGRHTHSGVVCCGTQHANGYCDGSCLTTVRPAWSSWSRHGGHCGHH